MRYSDFVHSEIRRQASMRKKYEAGWSRRKQGDPPSFKPSEKVVEAIRKVDETDFTDLDTLGII
jgi:hypothetical protein